MIFKPEIPKTHPPDDRENWFSTVDIAKILKFHFGVYRAWVNEGYLKARMQIEDGRGKVSYFTGFQLYTTQLFRYLLDIGISRKTAGQWIENFDRVAMLKKGAVNIENATYVVFEISNGKSVGTAMLFGNGVNIHCEGESDRNDYFVFNFRKIVESVDALIEMQ